MDARALLDSYYDLRTPLAGPPRHTSHKAVVQAERYLAWCAENEVDPVGFMKSRFNAFRIADGKAKYPTIAAMRSKSALERWHQFSGGQYYAAEQYERVKREMPSGLRVLVETLRAEPTRTQERMRYEYVKTERTYVCEAERRETGGYDARSKVCPHCPRKTECLLTLNRDHGFDVGALRIGLTKRLPLDVRNILNG